MGGFVFCAKVSTGAAVTADLPLANRTCCQNAASCSNYTSNKAWNCSTNFTNTYYAQSFCPFNTNSCGTTTPNINITAAGGA
jgi:hypothetical protein